MSRVFGFGLSVIAICSWTSLRAEEPTTDPEAIKFFESKVRPVLVARCLKCHGEAQQKGQLRLDSREAVLKGGESGEIVISGKPAESLLIEAINRTGLEMPPDAPLKENEIAALTEWVRRGLPWPTDNGKSRILTPGGKGITEADKQYWAFQRIRDPAVPDLKSEISNLKFQIRNPIDHFIVAKLSADGFTPAPEADRRTLIRRLTFDLTGLPPTPVEIAEFESDSRDDAYEQLVDRLLDSPAYGERWARHWLDLVRYAESDGYRKDDYRPHAWRYRDYVIRSFQTDKPFDRFVREQIAGDEIDPNNPDALAATGYLRLSLYEYNQRDARTQWNEILNDITDVTGDVFLGFGMGCARCHDHKFDPILQKDYFRLRAFFAGILPQDAQPLATKSEIEAHQAKLSEWEAKTADIRTKLAELEAPHLAKLKASAIFKFPAEIQAILKTDDVGKLAPLDRQLYDLAYRQVQYEHDQIGAKLKDDSKKKWDELRAELKKFDDFKPAPLPTGYAVADVGPIAPPTVIPGDKSETDIVPGLLSVLDDSPATIMPAPNAPQSTGRRTTLARWLTSPDNPLTPRVMVNRIWQYHFGKGLVATTSDFGRLGESPSHPELLDWLASRFAGRARRGSHSLVLQIAASTDRHVRDVSAVGDESERRAATTQRPNEPLAVASEHSPARCRTNPRLAAVGRRQAGCDVRWAERSGLEATTFDLHRAASQLARCAAGRLRFRRRFFEHSRTQRDHDADSSVADDQQQRFARPCRGVRSTSAIRSGQRTRCANHRRPPLGLWTRTERHGTQRCDRVPQSASGSQCGRSVVHSDRLLPGAVELQ